VPAGPLRRLVLASDEPLEVDPECVDVAAGSQSAQRNLDLRPPAVVGAAGFGPPALVPLDVDVLPFVGEHGIVLRAERIDAEVVGVAMVVKCIEDDVELILRR